MADLPDISTDLNDPLPESPDPSMTPYRIVARPGAGVEGPENVVTGWGRRGPITPPQPMGGGAVGGLPDISRAYTAAFQHLPVDEAVKAINVANKFVAMRGYQADLAKGNSNAEAIAKWGPMLFGSGTGIPEALKAIQAQKINPYQQAQLNQRQAEMLGRQAQAANALRQRQAELAARQAEAASKLEFEKEKGSVQREVTKAEITQDVKDLTATEKAIDKATYEKQDPKAIDDLRKKAGYLRDRIKSYSEQNPARPNEPAQKKRVKVIGPNGRKGTVEEGDTLPEGWSLVK